MNQKIKNSGKESNHLFEIRTDLAVEEKESFSGENVEVQGVSLREWEREESKIKLTEVKILDDRGAAAMGKAKGTYVTLEARQMGDKDDSYHEEVSEELADQLRRIIDSLQMKKEKNQLSALVVGLGNPEVTPDALGPRVLGNLQVTRHLQMQYGDQFCEQNNLPLLSGIVPGVMAQTGMETAEILMGIIHQTKPDLLIVIDALAARSIRRLGTTIQLTDTGIHPGSGVGNHRHSLTMESLGIPVVAIGVPTVVGAAAIVQDTVTTMIETLASNVETQSLGTFMDEMDPDQQYQLISELLEPEFGSLYVTPPDIDETIKQLSFTISEGIHQAFY